MCKHFLENIGSAIIPGYGEKKAADAQVTATEYGINKENEIYDVNKGNIANSLTSTSGMLAPWQQGGLNAFNQYGAALGLTPSDQPYGGFQQSPGYQFAFDEGMRGVNNAFASRGMLNSGARMKALTKYGQGIANQEFQRYLDNTNRAAAMGLEATGTGVNNAFNHLNLGVQDAARYADNFANLWQNKGAAQASRYGGIANAWEPLRSAGVSWLTGQLGGAGAAASPTNAIYGGYDPTFMGL